MTYYVQCAAWKYAVCNWWSMCWFAGNFSSSVKVCSVQCVTCNMISVQCEHCIGGRWVIICPQLSVSQPAALIHDHGDHDDDDDGCEVDMI